MKLLTSYVNELILKGDMELGVMMTIQIMLEKEVPMQRTIPVTIIATCKMMVMPVTMIHRKVKTQPSLDVRLLGDS